MASGQSMFKGAFGLDDWVWWLIIGGVALLLLLLLVCCCVCMQRAKRKGHEEALASVQARQRLRQGRERAEQQQQQQRYQQAQQPLDVTFANNNGFTNGHQPGYGYSKKVTTALLPKRKNPGPQVAANGFREHSSQLHTHQFAKPGQQEGQATGQQYQEPRKWYNADHAKSRNAPDVRTSSHYPDNIRCNDLDPRGGGTDEAPFMSVKSPLTAKANRKSKVRWQNQSPYDRETKSSIPAPIAMPTNTQTLANPLDTRSSTGLESGTSRSTLQSRIDALRLADTNDMVHSRISVESTDVPYLSAKTGDAVNTSAMSRALKAQDSYASGPARRSEMVTSNIMSMNSSTLANSFFSSPSSSLHSGDSIDTLDREGENTKSTVLGNALSHGSSRSIGSDYFNDQFEDSGSFGPGSSDFKRQNSSASSGRPTREDNESYNNRGSVEF
ncbi:unnamed protein product [Peronospora farinosa]|uniref:Uncharacterized protein n=1 Tax=Peronospora farinosa TaxID=134698 RepID=A0ABN8C745_9STRA|nr:unnamed protein product [Peronospora farinosa]